MKKVLFLFGGKSSEHYISCLSAKSILENIDRKKFDVVSVGISLENEWFIFDDDLKFLKDGNWLDISKGSRIDNVMDFIRKFDVVFPMIHGKYGEDGRIQALLDFLNIPFVGSDYISSGIGMDKELSKILFSSIGIPQVPYICFKQVDMDISYIVSTFSFPMIVKPCNGGSSIGISKVDNKKDLRRAIKEAFKYDSKVIVEPFIVARELECALIEKGNVHVSNVGEIISVNEFYDYNAKYENDKTVVIIPSDLPRDISSLIKKYAALAFKRIGARGLARIDFFYDEMLGKVYLNEINTLPGFTDISMYPKLIMDMGYSYKDIITLLIKSAVTK